MVSSGPQKRRIALLLGVGFVLLTTVLLIWDERDDLSLNGNDYSESIRELRIYKKSSPEYGYYSWSNLADEPFIFRTTDAATIKKILLSSDRTKEEDRGSRYCDRRSSEYVLYVVTLAENEELYGNFQVTPKVPKPDTPPPFRSCAFIAFFDNLNTYGWVSYDFLPQLQVLGITGL